jgi:hypothetical protein
MIALSIFRQLATLRPVGFLGQNSKRMGSIRSQSASGISQSVGRGLIFGFGLVFRFRLVEVVAIEWTLRSMLTFHCNSRRAKAKSAFSDSF